MSNENLPAINNFEGTMKLASQLSKSGLLPELYRGNPANCFVALQIAQSVQKPFFHIAQNLNIIYGRPSWSAQYIIAMITDKFGDEWEFKFKDLGEKKDIKYQILVKNQAPIEKIFSYLIDKECWVEATDKKGRILKGTSITLEMAIKEGWYTKPGSKWQTMPDQMLKYRAASFFASTYLAREKQGVMTIEEAEDIATERDVTPPNPGKTHREKYEELMLEFAKYIDTEFFDNKDREECRQKIKGCKGNLQLIAEYAEVIKLEYESRVSIKKKNDQEKVDTITILPVDDLFEDAEKGFTNAGK